MLKIALMTLTLTADGELRLTLSEMESAAACTAARSRVVEILTQSDITVQTALCDETNLRLTPYEHGADPDAETFFYRVQTDGKTGFAVTPVAPGTTCRAEPDKTPAVYCARSSQEVVDNG